jgi:hypothetical protein
MESELMEEYRVEMEYLTRKYQSDSDYLNSNPFMSQESANRQNEALKNQFEIDIMRLRDRITQTMVMGRSADKYSWENDCSKPMVEINSKKKINGKESCPELYKLLKARKSIHH